MSSSHSVSHSNSTAVSGQKKIARACLNQWPLFFSQRTAVISAPPSPGTIAFDSSVVRQSAVGEWVAVRHSISYWQGNGSFVNCKGCLSHHPADISLGGGSEARLNSTLSVCLSFSVSLNVLAHSGVSNLHLTL